MGITGIGAGRNESWHRHHIAPASARAPRSGHGFRPTLPASGHGGTHPTRPPCNWKVAACVSRPTRPVRLDAAGGVQPSDMERKRPQRKTRGSAVGGQKMTGGIGGLPVGQMARSVLFSGHSNETTAGAVAIGWGACAKGQMMCLRAGTRTETPRIDKHSNPEVATAIWVGQDRCVIHTREGAVAGGSPSGSMGRPPVRGWATAWPRPQPDRCWDAILMGPTHLRRPLRSRSLSSAASSRPGNAEAGRMGTLQDRQGRREPAGGSSLPRRAPVVSL